MNYAYFFGGSLGIHRPEFDGKITAIVNSNQPAFAQRFKEFMHGILNLPNVNNDKKYDQKQ